MTTANACVLVAVAMTVASCGLVIDPDLLVAGNGGSVARDDAGVRDGASEGAPPEAGTACGVASECVDAPPDGWTSILLADDARLTCPAGSSGATDVRVVEGDGATTCACDCGSNCGATLTITTATDPTCATAPATDPVRASTTCASTSLDVPSGFAMIASDGATCSPTDRTTKKNPTDGRICMPQETAGSGCQTGQRCLTSGPGYELCVARPGRNACPSSMFTKLRRVGTAVDDPRQCAGCSCTSSACGLELTLWTRPNCQSREALTLTAACAATDAVANVKSYTSKTTNGCAEATPSLPQGALAFENEETICCR
jgi:hypothetical protein